MEDTAGAAFAEFPSVVLVTALGDASEGWAALSLMQLLVSLSNNERTKESWTDITLHLALGT